MKNRNYPKSTKSETVNTLITAAISGIPVIGGPTSEIYSALVSAPLSKRREAWFASLFEQLLELEEQVNDISIEELSKNEAFISSLYSASGIAAKTHKIEKLEALKNCVINSALNIKIEEDLQNIFFDFIDTMTPSHVKILKLMLNGVVWQTCYPKDEESKIYILCEHVFEPITGTNIRNQLDNPPEIREPPIITVRAILRDLFAKNLLVTEYCSFRDKDHILSLDGSIVTNTNDITGLEVWSGFLLNKEDSFGNWDSFLAESFIEDPKAKESYSVSHVGLSSIGKSFLEFIEEHRH